MTHTRDSNLKRGVHQAGLMICSLGIAIRVAAASVVFAIVYGTGVDDKAEISVEISGPTIRNRNWGALDELQSGFLGFAGIVFFYEIHTFTAGDVAIIVSYLGLNVGIVAVSGLLLAVREVLSRNQTRCETATQ